MTDSRVKDYLQMPALGRTTALGDLYDVRKEVFRGSVFKGPISRDCITEVVNTSMDQKLILSSTLTDKLNLFDIKQDIRASVLFGLVSANGSAAYLMEDKKTGRQSDGAMVIKTYKATEELNIFYDELQALYHTDLLQRIEATHVVTGIRWGANVVMSFTDTSQGNRNKNELHGHMNMAFKTVKVSVDGGREVNWTGLDEKITSRFSIDIYGDIKLPQEFAQSFQEAKELLRKIPEIIESTNGGKGVQLEFKLTPLSHLREFLKLDSKADTLFQKCDEGLLNDVIKFFDNQSILEKSILGLIQRFKANLICVPEESMRELEKMHEIFSSSLVSLKNEAKGMLVDVRSGRSSPRVLTDIIDKFKEETNAYNEKNVNEQLKGDCIQGVLDKIDLYENLERTYQPLMYLGRNLQKLESGHIDRRSSLSERLQYVYQDRANNDKVIYVLFMKDTWKTRDERDWNEHRTLLTELSKQSDSLIVVADCDFSTEQDCPVQNTTIKQVYKENVLVEDFKRWVPR